MITQIQLDKVASYKNPSSIDTDKPINLVYGLNGSGKTTISNYLKDHKNENYSNCVIEHDHSSNFVLRIYNQKFVDEIFYNQDTQNGIFTLSKENKKAENQIKEATSKKATIEEEGKKIKDAITDKEAEIDKTIELNQNDCFKIKQEFTGGDRTFDEAKFLDGYKRKAPLFEKLLSLQKTQSERNIDSVRTDVERLTSSNDSMVDLLPLIDNTADGFGIIESESILLESIVGKTNSTLSKLIDHLENTDWFTKGIGYLTDSNEQCPFCQQSVNEELKNEITDFLDESYQIKIDTVATLEKTSWIQLINATFEGLTVVY